MYTDAEKRQIMEKVKLSRKEDLLRTVRGEDPESVQIIAFGWDDYVGGGSYRIVGPSLYDESHLIGIPNGYVDSWGVKYECNRSTNYAAIPAPGSALITCDDLDHWRDIIKVPEVPKDIDWDLMARKDWERSKIDHNESAACAIIGIMPFQELIGIMGFEECFMAFYEEPEAIHEIIDEIEKIYVEIGKNAVDHYTIDYVYLCDDTASAMAPFISKDMYDEFMLPLYKAITKPYVERGIPLQFHNCGNCTIFLDEMKNFGVKVWDPAQTMNDVIGLQKKYGREFLLAGAFDWTPPLDLSGITREFTDEMIHNYVDKMTENAPFFASAGCFGLMDDPDVQRVNSWMAEELFYYTRAYYTR